MDADVDQSIFEFDHSGFVASEFEDQVNPVQRIARVGGWVGNPVANPDVAVVFVRAPWNAGRDNVQTLHVGGVVTPSQVGEPLPMSGLRVPEVPDSGAPGLGEGTSFSQAARS